MIPVVKDAGGGGFLLCFKSVLTNNPPLSHKSPSRQDGLCLVPNGISPEGCTTLVSHCFLTWFVYLQSYYFSCLLHIGTLCYSAHVTISHGQRVVMLEGQTTLSYGRKGDKLLVYLILDFTGHCFGNFSQM